MAGASGIRAHQQKLDVVANNIANLNTTGFKKSDVLFSDLIYTDYSNAVGASTVTGLGGTNPKQVGNGVQVASITSDFSQGVLSTTGSELDFAIEGNGFFVVGGDVQEYTRDGSFSVDSTGYLVDPATGKHVQRIGSVGETLNGQPGFQVSGDTRINIPLGAAVAGQGTTSMDLLGNLPSSAVPPITEILTTAAPWTAGGSPITNTSLLNDLDFNIFDYTTGDTIEIGGTNFDGSSFSFSLAAGPTTTIGDLTTEINSNMVGGAVEITPTGNLLVRADQPGDALLSLTINDGDTNVGESSFEDVRFVVETDGKDADVFRSTVQIFDNRGTPHALNVAYEKTDFNTWNAVFTPGNPNVTLLDGEITEISFNEQGVFQAVNGVGDGDANIELTIQSNSGTQAIQFSLDSLSHLATNFTATYEQDGFSPGTIIAMEVDANGTLSGIANNGRRVEVAQLAIASFNNVHGLSQSGENYFVQSATSGEPTIGTGNSSGRGQVRGGQLEASNVDVAFEFTQLIIAQRGFSANARTITIATEVLQELNNIF